MKELASLLAVALALFLGSRQARTQDTTDYVVNILQFGAPRDGRTDASAAIQAALDSVPLEGGTVFIPAGVFRIGSPLVIRRSYLSLLGSGTQSVLRLMDGVTRDLIVLPSLQGTDLPDISVSDIRIARLALDGNGNATQKDLDPNYFGIFVRCGNRISLEELQLSNFRYDAIAIGVADRPSRGVEIRKCHIASAGRNGIHFGFGSDLRVVQTWIEDTPSQRWGPAAGNGIDVEVEGLNPFVDGFLIEDNLIERTNTQTAGDGIALQPAFGPIRNGVIRRNFIRNHQAAVESTGDCSNYETEAPVSNIEISGNWVLYDHTTHVTGITFALLGTTEVQVLNNRINDIRQRIQDAGMLLRCVRNANVAGNSLWSGSSSCAVRIAGASRGIRLERNQFVDCFLDISPGAKNISEQENIRIGMPEAYIRNPDGILSLEQQWLVPGNTRVEVGVAGGSDVARVFFFVDGIPQSICEKAPFAFQFEPERFSVGAHEISAVIIDTAANRSRTKSLEVLIPRPAKKVRLLR